MDKGSKAAKLAAALIGTMLGLIVAEGALQLFWESDVAELQRGMSVVGTGKTLEIGGIRYEINSIGLRDRDLETDRDTGPVVLTLGDSFVFGFGLPKGDLLSTQLEHRLRSELSNVRVINAGHSGFNTSDEYRELVRLTPLLRPDVVLVFFFTNDVLSRNRAGEYASKRQYAKEFLRRKSRLMALVYSFWKGRLAGTLGTPEFMLAADYFDFSDENKGWVQFERATRAIRSYCRDRDIALMFVLIPTLTHLNAHYPYRKLRSAVRAHLESEAIEYLDLFEVFAEVQPSDLWVSRENTHWNGAATAMAAEALAGVLLLPSWKQVWVSGKIGKRE